MSEPKTFIDYEFHFANGQMLSVTLEQGRDQVEEDLEDNALVLTVRHSPNCVETMTIVRNRLLAIRETERTVTDEESQ